MPMDTSLWIRTVSEFHGSAVFVSFVSEAVIRRLLPNGLERRDAAGADVPARAAEGDGLVAAIGRSRCRAVKQSEQFGRKVATAEEARKIMKCGVGYDTVEAGADGLVLTRAIANDLLPAVDVPWVLGLPVKSEVIVAESHNSLAAVALKDLVRVENEFVKTRR